MNEIEPNSDYCKLRQLHVEQNNFCDLYKTKRKPKGKLTCKSCVHFGRTTDNDIPQTPEEPKNV